jgi:hypothetical protein
VAAAEVAAASVVVPGLKWSSWASTDGAAVAAADSGEMVESIESSLDAAAESVSAAESESSAVVVAAAEVAAAEVAAAEVAAAEVAAADVAAADVAAAEVAAAVPRASSVAAAVGSLDLQLGLPWRWRLWRIDPPGQTHSPSQSKRAGGWSSAGVGTAAAREARDKSPRVKI